MYKPDITNREDIKNLIELFYKGALTDPHIGYFFTEVVALDFKEHIPRICDFWEAVLFRVSAYNGNPMLKHIALSRKSKMTAEHFDTWLKLWNESVDNLFEGEKAEEVKKRAKTMKALMLYKIELSGNDNWVQ